MKQFEIGSNAFFSKFPDYTPRVANILYIDDNPDYGYETSYMDENGIHIIRWKNMTKEELMTYHKDCYVGRYIGKFLVPEYAEYFGITIDGLKELHHLIDFIDERHIYEKMIYDFYIKNNGFFLTDDQLKEVYDEYKKERGL